MSTRSNITTLSSFSTCCRVWSVLNTNEHAEEPEDTTERRTACNAKKEREKDKTKQQQQKAKINDALLGALESHPHRR
jgi:hypothetical protein